MEIPLLRSKIFYLLSRFFLQTPDKNFIKKLFSGEFLETMERVLLFEDNLGALKESIEKILYYLKGNRERPLEELRTELGVDFTKLVRGIKKGYGPPPPYESVWRGEDRVWGYYTEEVLKFYEKAGIGMDLEDEIPDFLGLELKFLSLLSYHESKALEEGKGEEAKRFQELQKEFLKEHLLQWAPRYLAEMYLQAETDFYKGVASLTSTFLKTFQ